MPPEPPSWLDEATLHRLRAPPARALPASEAETRDRLWARFPALPLTAIEEAARFLHPPAGHGRRAWLLARLAARLRPSR